MVKGFREQLDSDDENNQGTVMYVVLFCETIKKEILSLKILVFNHLLNTKQHKTNQYRH